MNQLYDLKNFNTSALSIFLKDMKTPTQELIIITTSVLETSDILHTKVMCYMLGI